MKTVKPAKFGSRMCSTQRPQKEHPENSSPGRHYFVGSANKRNSLSRSPSKIRLREAAGFSDLSGNYGTSSAVYRIHQDLGNTGPVSEVVAVGTFLTVGAVHIEVLLLHEVEVVAFF